MLRILLDRDVPITNRLSLLKSMQPGDLVTLREPLLQLAVDPDECAELAHMVGVCLAMLSRLGTPISDLILADLSGPAYLGYDEEMTKILTASHSP